MFRAVCGDAPARRAGVQTATELPYHSEEVGVIAVRAMNVVFVVGVIEDVNVRREDACKIPGKIKADEGEGCVHVHALAESEIVREPGFADDEFDELVG